MFDGRTVYKCNVCGTSKHVSQEYSVSDMTLICCGVMMVKVRSGMVTKPARGKYVRKA